MRQRDIIFLKTSSFDGTVYVQKRGCGLCLTVLKEIALSNSTVILSDNAIFHKHK